MDTRSTAKTDMDEAMILRRSTRCTKGVPPRRYAASEITNMVSSRARVPETIPSALVIPTSVHDALSAMAAPKEVVSQMKSKSENSSHSRYGDIDVRSQQFQEKSVISRKSEASKLNLELKIIEEQEQLDREEAAERLRMIEKKREVLNRKMEIRKKIIDTESINDKISEYSGEEKMYSSDRLHNWIDDARKCATVETIPRLENTYSLPAMELPMNNGSSNKTNGILADIAKQCVENAATTNKLLLRQKLRDLTTFTGELSEWPIFFSEYQRTKKSYGLSDDENLLRLDRALKGRARDTVKALLTSSANVPKIVKMLEMNFGRPEWIIFSLMDKVKKLNPIDEDRLESSIFFLNSVSNMVTTINNVGCKNYLYNPELLSSLVEKLPQNQKYSWAKVKYKLEKEEDNYYTSLEDFVNWFEEEVNSIATISNPFQKNPQKPNPKKENVFVSKKTSDKKDQTANGCAYCNSPNHVIAECGDFLEIPIIERRVAVLERKLCFICLKVGHLATRCFNQKIRCTENGCKGKHNKLLHLKRSSTEKPQPSTSTKNNEKPGQFCANQNMSAGQSVLLRIASVKVRGPAGESQVFALFDEGSTCTMIEAALAAELQLNGPTISLCFQWTNGINYYEDDSKAVSFEIAADSSNSSFYEMKEVRTVSNLDLPLQRFDVEEMMKKFPYLDSKILESVRFVKPKMLIGQDNCGLIIPRKIIQPRLNQPIMSKSKLGWIIHGPLDNEGTDSIEHVSLCCNQSMQDDELDRLVKDSFCLEDFGIKQKDNVIKSLEDKKALDIMNNTMQKVGNHYSIGHLWRNAHETLPDSRQSAIKRLYCMERKMDKDQQFAEQYCNKIIEYLDEGYAKILDADEVVDTPKTWYLPHFAVWNINKPGKIRLVFDAAAKSHGSSLNDFLLQGPNLVPSLIRVLWRFRQGRVAVNGDIAEIFHQVLIREEDRCAQRFFWRGMDRKHSPRIYKMDVMIFGAISSPAVAQFVKNTDAEKLENQYPGIERAVKKQHYVDDYLDSFYTEEEAVEQVKNVITVHLQAVFKMTKWTSNSKKVIASIPANLRAVDPGNLKIDTEKYERVLGLSWSQVTDSLVFTFNLKKIDPQIWKCQKIPTKREVLRVTMSVFDPLGFLAPIMIKARILMQNIWRYQIHWDTEITEELLKSWKLWVEELQNLVPISLPRYYFPSCRSQIHLVDLHVFCDASDKSYAAVAFLCFKENESIQTSLVGCKFKVAPLKQQTIPKLELQAALLGIRLARSISSEIEYKIQETHFWSDSMVVLSQIRSESKHFPIFVACRLEEIYEFSTVKQWHWVPSALNVADLATKVMKTSQFTSESMWLRGPDFLRSVEKNWPKEPINQCKEKEDVLVTRTAFDVKQPLPDIHRFSKWSRLIRSTAWVIYFSKILRRKKTERPRTLLLNLDMISEATKMWIRRSQLERFEDELKTLKLKKILSKSSRLFKLSVFLDEDHILRISGRIPGDVEIDNDSRNPIVLDYKHKYTELLIKHHHETAGHVGMETVVNNLRTKFWIIKIRQAVKKCFRTCQICKIKNCKPANPEMGYLPKERVESYVYPFSYVGVDFFGPMNISIGRRIEKRYDVLFTCLSIRAVHIELSASLDTSSTISAIRRFMCRRGQPKEFISDNGTNFVGAERELKEWIQSLDQDVIVNFLSLEHIKWKFNPARASHMGGVWERMIRTVKTALKISLKSVNPSEEVLHTLLLEIEYMMNSRPLTHISIDPMEPEAITPNHFLLLRPGGVLTCATDEKVSRKQWRIAQSLADSFWRRWIREYRPTLIQRSKWHSKTDLVKVNDIVLIVDEKAPRNTWQLGRIEQVYPGKDDVIRVVEIRTNRGVYTRPVTKICVIPTSGE